MGILKKIFQVTAAAVLAFLIAAVAFEGFWHFLLFFPSITARMPAGIRNRVELLYIESARKILQTEPYAVQYHPYLAYTLRPGTWQFSNPEFKNTFNVNHLGFRDDEASLEAPEVIVAGDSHAMGWGVEQQETFAQIIEQESGYKVLNMAVASYGTVREMRALDLIDTSRLRYLIIQYCDNDYEENKTFFMGKNRIEINTKEEQSRAIFQSRKERRYWPGKYSYMVITSLYEAARNKMGKPLAKPKTPQKDYRDEGFLFINAVMNASRADLSNVGIIAFEIKAHGGDKSNQNFLNTLKVTLVSNNFPPLIQRMRIIDFSEIFDLKRDFYFLDDHLNARGHQTVAASVLRAMKEMI